MSITPHPRAWTVTTDDPGGVGTVVQEGEGDDAYWWVLCPATSTLVLSAEVIEWSYDPSKGERYSNPFCCDGEACDWAEWHLAANTLIVNQAGDA